MESCRVMSVTKKDVVVIGGGPAGYVAAIRLGQLGKKVLLIEEDRIGGVCLNWGCIPSKALIYFASLFDKMKKSESMGLTVTGASADLNKFQTWKNDVVRRLTTGVATLCKGVGVEIILGKARFKSAHEIERVGFDDIIEAETTVIATGAKSILLPNFPLESPSVVTSKEALDLTSVPKDLLVIGGGVIGLELGMAFQKLGSRLTVVEMTDRLLPGTDPDLVRVVERSLKKRETQIFLNSKAVSYKKNEVVLETPEGNKMLTPDTVLVSVGFVPNVKELGLDLASVKQDAKGFILIDKQAKTSVDSIYAIGDVTGPPFLAHKGFKEGEIAAEVIAGQSRSLDYQAMPAAIFTDPEIATVGLTEAKAKEEGHDVTIGRYPLGASGRALTMGQSDGMMKMVIDKESHQILGAHIVAPEASELIGEVTLAIEMGALAEDVAGTIHPHPTLSEGIMEGFKQTIGEAIHIPNLPRL